MAEYPVFHIDKDDDRAIHFAKDFYERVIEAQNLALMNEINANAVVINGRKYGMLKDKPGVMPTIFGMKAETRTDMPDEWDFFLQERPPQPQTNYDRIISKSPEELAEWIAERSTAPNCTGKCHNDYEVYGELRTFCHDCWLDWLKQEAAK